MKGKSGAFCVVERVLTPKMPAGRLAIIINQQQERFGFCRLAGCKSLQAGLPGTMPSVAALGQGRAEAAAIRPALVVNVPRFPRARHAGQCWRRSSVSCTAQRPVSQLNDPQATVDGQEVQRVKLEALGIEEIHYSSDGGDPPRLEGKFSYKMVKVLPVRTPSTLHQPGCLCRCKVSLCCEPVEGMQFQVVRACNTCCTPPLPHTPLADRGAAEGAALPRPAHLGAQGPGGLQ